MLRSIALDDHFEKFVTEQVGSGRFDTPDDVVHAGLRLLEQHELRRHELRALIDAGDRDYADGRFTVFETAGDLTTDIVARGQARSAGTGQR